MPLLERHHYFIYYHEEKPLPNYITNIWVFEMLICGGGWGGMCILEFMKCSKFCKLKDIFHFWGKNYLIAFTSHLLAQSDFLKKAKGVAFEDDLIFFFFFF